MAHKHGREELPQVRGQGWWQGGATPRPRPGAAAGRSKPTSKERWVAAWVQEGLEELFHVQGQKGQREEIPLVQGKDQWLPFAGAAMKRYPTPKVRETQVIR